MPGVEHRSHKGLNNRAENSHLPLRRRERRRRDNVSDSFQHTAKKPISSFFIENLSPPQTITNFAQMPVPSFSLLPLSAPDIG